MADNREIVGWFYRNGKRIPIKGKKKDNRISSDRGNTTDLDNAVNEARGVHLESSVAQDMRNHNRVRDINGDRVELYGNSAGKGLYKKESATFNQYSDGGKELINFRREPWNEGLRRNAKGLGRTRSPKEKRTWLENHQKEERRKLMRSRGVTSWGDVPEYLKQSTGSQTPGSEEMRYGTKPTSKKVKKGSRKMK